MDAVPHSFAPRDLVAGRLALDLVNTVTARNTPRPLDWLDGYGKLLDWAELAEAADSAALSRLRELAQASPDEAEAALKRLRGFREALHDVLEALIGGHAVPAARLAVVEAAWKAAAGRARLTPVAGRVESRLEPGGSGLDLIVDLLARDAVELLQDFPNPRARICPGDHCGWMFLDTSKGGRRVWCDMATCGNLAKSRRHYALHRRDA